MLQRFPYLRGRVLYLLRYSSLRTRAYGAAGLLSGEPACNDKRQIRQINTERKFKCPICGGAHCKCGSVCEHVSRNYRYYASAAALLLAAGLVFNRNRKKKSAAGSSSDDKLIGTSSEASEPTPEPGPFEQDNLPAEIPYLLIGAGTASYYAALTIRARDADAKVLIIGDERHLPYNRPNLTKELWWYGEDKVEENLEYKSLSGRTKDVYYETKGFFVSPSEIIDTEHGGVALMTGHRVVRLDIPQHEAFLDDGRKIKYGKCLIATGLSPCSSTLIQDASPEVKKKISTFHTVEDFKRLYKIAKDAKSITIIGSNILASELAYSLNRKFGEKGLKVNQVFKEKGIVPEILPEYLSETATEDLRNAGVNVITEEVPVSCALNESGSVELVLGSGEVIPSDHVVVISETKPNTELAGPSNMEVDEKRGGFLVDAELRARTDVWVAGAVCNYYDVRLGRRRAELWDDANVTGRLAGENMTGGQKPYWHQAAYYSVVAPEVHLQGVGRTEPQLPTISVFASDDDGESKPKRGVVFYMNQKTVVGVLLYNVFGYGTDVARRIIADGREHEESDLREIAKLFELHKAEIPKDNESTEESPKGTDPALSEKKTDSDKITESAAPETPKSDDLVLQKTHRTEEDSDGSRSYAPPEPDKSLSEGGSAAVKADLSSSVKGDK